MNQPLTFNSPEISHKVSLEDFIDADTQLHRLEKSKKTNVYRQHDTAHSLYQVYSGIIKNYRTTAEGIEQITDFHLPGEIFGFEVLAATHYCSNTAAVTDSAIAQLSIKDYDFNREAYQILSKKLTQEYIRSNNHIAMLNKTRAAIKVATFLININQRLNIGKNNCSEFNFPRTDMANYLGLSVETVCRELKKLKESNVIDIKKTRLILKDLPQLIETTKL